MGSISDRFRVKQMTGRMPNSNSGVAFNRTAQFAANNMPASRAAAEREALKGVYLGNCNVTACQQPGATWWNTAMGKFYCRSCAKAINAPGWPLGDKTPIICFDRSIYLEYPEEVEGV